MKATPRWLHRMPWHLWPLLLIVAVLLTPIVSVLSSFFQGPAPSWPHLVDTVLWEYTLNSIYLVLGVGFGVLVLGVSSAWFVARYEFFGRRQFEWLLLLPLSMPAYIIAYTYTGILDFSGPVQSFIRKTFSVGYGDYYFPEIRSIGGAIVMMSLVLYPYVYLLARTSFKNQSQSLADAGKSLGLSPLQSFCRIALPIARPAIIAGTILALMETLADYGTVQYFGVNVFSTGIFRTWFGLDDALAARQLASVLLMMVFALLLLEKLARSKASYSLPSGSMSSKRRSLKPVYACVVSLCCGLLFLFGFLLPFTQLLYWSLFERTKGFDQEYCHLLSNSLQLAGITSLLTVLLALLLSYSQRLWPSKLFNGAVFTAGLGYAIPGTIIAIGVMAPFSWLDHSIHDFFEKHSEISTGLIFSGTLFILIFAYIVRFLAVALGNIKSGLLNIHQSIDDAAKSLGLTPWQSIVRIHLPLLRPSLISAALLVFVDTLKELPATLVLRPFNFNTLAVKSFELANDEQLANAAPSVITIVLIGLIPVILLNFYMQRSQN